MPQNSSFTTRQRRRTASRRTSDSAYTLSAEVQFEVNRLKPSTTYSTEIAKLTGKTHAEVMSEIHEVLNALKLCPGEFLTESTDGSGTLVPSFKLRRFDPCPHTADPNMVRAVLLQYVFDNQERVRELQEKLSENAEKVEFYDTMMETNDAFNLGIVAKTLGTGKTRLLRYLRKHGVLTAGGYKMNLPYQQHLDCGRFKVEWGSYKDKDGVRRLKPTPLVTGKGAAWLTKFIEKHGRAGL